MGMFDYVKFKIKCPNCGKLIDNFQSKDSVCLMNNLEFWEVDNFYSSCTYCNTWVEFTLKERKKRKISKYNKTIKIPTKKEQIAHRNKYKEFGIILRRN